jgi:cytidine deaminase
MYDKDGKSVVMTLGQLLPMSFGPEKLLTTDQVALDPPQEAQSEEN